MHTCCILGAGGLHWPCPTFRVLASDRPDEPLDAKSPTGAWNAALSRINAEIEARYGVLCCDKLAEGHPSHMLVWSDFGHEHTEAGRPLSTSQAAFIPYQCRRSGQP